MLLCQLLVPVRRDASVDRPNEKNGRGVFNAIESRLLARFGGFTHCGKVSGAWTDASGVVIRDVSRVYQVAAESFGDVASVAEWIATEAGQQCILVAQLGEATFAYAATENAGFYYDPQNAPAE